MIRRLFRVAVRGLCLLSIPLCLLAAALWWHAERYGFDTLDIAWRPAKVRLVVGDGDMCGVILVRGWPERAEFWGQLATRNPTGGWVGRPPETDFKLFAGTDWRYGPFNGSTGSARAFVGPDGRVRRLELDEAMTAPRDAGGMTGPLPYGTMFAHMGVVVALFALPPLIWFGTAGRRALVRRRRARTGRCVHCGYEIRATTGRCPECGAVPNHSEGAA